MSGFIKVNGPDDFAAAFSVSRETLDSLSAYVGLLERWQAKTNLVSPKTLPHIWQRHIADSAQLLALADDARVWLDLGAGAGFPGMVIATMRANQRNFRMILVESNAKKCAFLAEAARVVRAPVEIIDRRIESVDPSSIVPAPEIVSSRALAPLSALLGLAAPHLEHGARGLFMKGREAQTELDAARRVYDFSCRVHRSRTEPEGAILDVQGPVTPVKEHR